jgi:hypothetical protein
MQGIALALIPSFGNTPAAGACNPIYNIVQPQFSQSQRLLSLLSPLAKSFSFQRFQGLPRQLLYLRAAFRLRNVGRGGVRRAVIGFGLLPSREPGV